MRIGFDARKESDGGIGRYIRNLIAGLRQTPEISHLHVWVRPKSEILRRPSPRFHPRVERAGFYTLREQVALGCKVRQSVLDLFHEPHYVVPFFLNIPLVVTIHDIIHLIFPRSYLHREYAKRQIAYATKRAKQIITPSEFSRRELLRFFPMAAAKTRAILHGLAPFFSPGPDAEDATLCHTLNLPESFLFYAGNHKPHKNLPWLLETCRETFRDFPDLYLCLTGTQQEERGTVWRTARHLGVEQRIRFLGNLDNRELRICYRHAKAFVFPSLYEGFGFPPLEAMACGAPVVAFRVASLPEVIGEGGILVPPNDRRAFLHALDSLLSDEEARQTWAHKGRRQAARFQWDTAIRQHLSVYQQALAPPSV